MLSLSNSSWTLRSLKGTHFTTAIAQNAIDIEAIASAQKELVVSSISIWSVQNLDWDIMFFKSISSQPSSDPDLDTMTGRFLFSNTTAVQVAGAGLFRHFLGGLDFRYSTNTGNFNIGLINRHATGKEAGATGYFVIELNGPLL